MKKLKYLFRAFRYRYKLDVPEIQFLLQKLQPGDTCLDIGSHKGGYLYWMQKRVGEQGKIYAFEPQKKLYAYLKEIVGLCNYQNVVVENKGVSAKSGKVNFFIPITKSGSSPGARVDNLEEETNHQKIEIEVISLDDYFQSKKIFPNLIKIDVEGHEKEVLLGAQNLLKTSKPYIIMECENRHLKGASIFEIFEILIEMGYQGYFFEGRKRKPLHQFDLSIHQKQTAGKFWERKGYVNNFIFENEP